jgi:hypothetical protein
MTLKPQEGAPARRSTAGSGSGIGGSAIRKEEKDGKPMDEKAKKKAEKEEKERKEKAEKEDKERKEKEEKERKEREKKEKELKDKEDRQREKEAKEKERHKEKEKEKLIAGYENDVPSLKRAMAALEQQMKEDREARKKAEEGLAEQMKILNADKTKLIAMNRALMVEITSLLPGKK